MKTIELLSEIRYNEMKPKRYEVEIEVPPNTPGAYQKMRQGPGGRTASGEWYKLAMRDMTNLKGEKILGKTYYDPEFRVSKRDGSGDILGTVGDWLREMGASVADLPKALEKVKASPEYQHILSLGVEDESSAADLKNGTLRFAAKHEGIIGGGELSNPFFLRKVLANGNIRTYSGHGGEHHAGRGRVPHPPTAKTHPNMDPVDRIAKAMRDAIKIVADTFQAQAKKHFIKSMKG